MWPRRVFTTEGTILFATAATVRGAATGPTHNAYSVGTVDLSAQLGLVNSRLALRSQNTGGHDMKRLNQVLVVLGLAVAFAAASVPTGAAPSKPRSVCIAAPTGGGSFNTFVLRDVESLSAGGAISLRGLYFVTSSQRVASLHGSAAMASDGSVRLGLFVHTTAESSNDFTVSGVTDANFVGTVSFDNDGDFLANGTLTMQLVDCTTLSIP
jgi:hypothetical protein